MKMDNFSDRPKFSDKWSSNQMSSLEEEEENKNPKHSSYLRRFESLMKRKGDKGSSPRAKVIINVFNCFLMKTFSPSLTNKNS